MNSVVEPVLFRPEPEPAPAPAPAPASRPKLVFFSQIRQRIKFFLHTGTGIIYITNYEFNYLTYLLVSSYW